MKPLRHLGVLLSCMAEACHRPVTWHSLRKRMVCLSSLATFPTSRSRPCAGRSLTSTCTGHVSLALSASDTLRGVLTSKLPPASREEALARAQTCTWSCAPGSAGSSACAPDATGHLGMLDIAALQCSSSTSVHTREAASCTTLAGAAWVPPLKRNVHEGEAFLGTCTTVHANVHGTLAAAAMGTEQNVMCSATNVWRFGHPADHATRQAVQDSALSAVKICKTGFR